MYDAEAKKSMIHGFSIADSPIGPYRMELVMIVSFNETGDQVVKYALTFLSPKLSLVVFSRFADSFLELKRCSTVRTTKV